VTREGEEDDAAWSCVDADEDRCRIDKDDDDDDDDDDDGNGLVDVQIIPR
jgi:hypothetical protein